MCNEYKTYRQLFWDLFPQNEYGQLQNKQISKPKYQWQILYLRKREVFWFQYNVCKHYSHCLLTVYDKQHNNIDLQPHHALEYITKYM